MLTYVVQQETGLPANRVIGSGTSLDTARFRQMIGEACEMCIRDRTQENQRPEEPSGELQRLGGREMCIRDRGRAPPQG